MRKAYWINTEPAEPDLHVAFRGTFELPNSTTVELRTLGASWYHVYLNGAWLIEGPLRFAASHPEYTVTTLTVPAGTHVLAVHLHHDGVETRMLPNLPPFWWCQLRAAGVELPIAWRWCELPGYQRRTRRLNPILGWMEYHDTRDALVAWQQPGFADHAWQKPTEIDVLIGPPCPPSVGPVKHTLHDVQPIACGSLTNTFGSPTDDIPTQFFLRALDDPDLPTEGVWRRYDLGRVRLGRPAFTLDLPRGAEIEFAYSEQLQHDRVVPWINWSTGQSCNLDRYVASGGTQTFGPLSPRGGRYLEVHVLARPDNVVFLREQFIERHYYAEPAGHLDTDDRRLDSIWRVGVETLQACSEDAITDNPTRERGQWIGDSVSVGMEVAAAAFADLRPFSRAMRQAVHCADSAGLVAGLCPGTPLTLAPYACHWTCACVRYYELTADRTWLEEMYVAALRNMAAFEARITPDGLAPLSDWIFIDWGYPREPGPTDLTFDMLFLRALRAMQRWAAWLADTKRCAHFKSLNETFTASVHERLQARLRATDEIGEMPIHQSALGLTLGLFTGADEPSRARAIKRHISSCFPLNPSGQRLSSPFSSHGAVFTPFFAHFVLPPLVARGEADFAFDVLRRAWGWMLEAGLTTFAEVFDTRWSHCHEWSGTPTWMLSRYLLGLHPRGDLGLNHYDLRLAVGSRPRAAGSLPLMQNAGTIHVEWQRDGDTIMYRAVAPTPVTLHVVPPLVCPGAPESTSGTEIALQLRA